MWHVAKAENVLSKGKSLVSRPQSSMWEFPKMGVPYFGVLIIRILLFRVLYWDPLIFGNSHVPCPAREYDSERSILHRAALTL